MMRTKRFAVASLKFFASIIFFTVITLAAWPGIAVGQARVRDFWHEVSRDAISDKNEDRIWTTELHTTVLRTARLYWRCNGGAVELFVLADEFLNSDDPIPTQWRFDQTTPSPLVEWTVSTSGTAAFAPASLIPLFSSQARKARRVVVRLTDYRGVNYNLQFSLSGVTAALQRLPCNPPELTGSVYLNAKAREVLLYGSTDPQNGIALLRWHCTDDSVNISVLRFGLPLSEKASEITALFDGRPLGDFVNYIWGEVREGSEREFSEHAVAAGTLALRFSGLASSVTPISVSFGTNGLGEALLGAGCLRALAK